MADSLTIETWTEFGVGMAFLLVRLYARVDILGFRRLQMDDFFAVMAMIFWTMQTTIIHYLGVLGHNIGLNEETAMLIPDSAVPRLALGSKLAFINWIWYPCFLWSLKGVMLCLYHRLTEGTRQHKYVLIMAAIVGVTWAACFVTHMSLCQPLRKNWQVKPYAGDNCTIRQPNYLVVAVGNVVTDAGIMLIALPLLFGLQVSLQRKIILGLMFSSGIFVMICAILRVYFSFLSIESLSVSLGWATRESFVAAVVVSLPGIKPLFRNSRLFGSANGRQTPGGKYGSNGLSSMKSGAHTHTKITSRSHNRDRSYELSSGMKGPKSHRVSSGDSEEYILGSNGRSNTIQVTTEYAIRRE